MQGQDSPPDATSCPLLGTRRAKPVLARLLRLAFACLVASSRSNLRASRAASSFGRGNTCSAHVPALRQQPTPDTTAGVLAGAC